MSFKSTAILLGAFAASALAHGTVTGFTADGVKEKGYSLDNYYKKQNGQQPEALAAWSAENLDNGFIAPDAYGTVDINCHKNGAPGTETATVAAGGTVDFQWSDWPDSHIGPVFTYIAKCAASCSDADPATLQWVKIDEGGYDVATKKWAATKLIDDGDSWTTTVPSDIAPGNYVFRHEIIAMHGAGSENGAQNYPQCFNIKITGSGTAQPKGVLGTELYKATDPGILFNPYGEITSYDIPGPALYGKGSSGGGSGSAPAPAPPATTPAPAPPSGGNGTLPIIPVPTTIATSVIAPVASEPAGGDDYGSAPVVPPPTATQAPVTCNKRRRRSVHARRHVRALVN